MSSFAYAMTSVNAYIHKKTYNTSAEVGEVSGLVPRRNPWMPYTHMPYICHMNCMSCQLQAERDEVPRGIFSIVHICFSSVSTQETQHIHIYITAEVGEVSGHVPRRNPWKPYIHAYHVIICISKSSIDSGAQASIKKHLLFSLSLCMKIYLNFNRVVPACPACFVLHEYKTISVFVLCGTW